MDAAVPFAFVALIAAGWYGAMRRFQLSRWTVLVALVVLLALLITFFRAEDEDEPEASRGATRAAATALLRDEA